MILTVAYDRKTFWNATEPVQDIKEHAGAEDLQKAFRALRKDRNFVIHIDREYSIYYEQYTDWENGIVTIKEYGTGNIFTTTSYSFEKAKKEIMRRYK